MHIDARPPRARPLAQEEIDALRKDMKEAAAIMRSELKRRRAAFESDGVLSRAGHAKQARERGNLKH